MKKTSLLPVLFFFILCQRLYAQTVQRFRDSVVITGSALRMVVNTGKGTVAYHFAGGASLQGTVACVEDRQEGLFFSDAYTRHDCTVQQVNDSIGKGLRVTVKHADEQHALSITQHMVLYATSPFLLLQVEATKKATGNPVVTRYISPLAILPAHGGHAVIPGTAPRVLDAPFDNDNWVGAVTRSWPVAGSAAVSGISYEFTALYNRQDLKGMVLGSVEHDCWKTGIRYSTGNREGLLDTLVVFAGAATADDPALPPLYGGLDGTHDHAPHGWVSGPVVRSPQVYVCGGSGVREALSGYGRMNAAFNGRLYWKGEAPVYWNSFGVEDVLGARNIMQPQGVRQVADSLQSLEHFNSHRPVLSIDSYDQSIYTTEVLASIAAYGADRNQRMGFYFIPFAVWTWRDSLNKLLPGTQTPLRAIVLRDTAGKPIFYKEGKFGAYAIDPTHPVTRTMMVRALQKAKAVHASFIKIDFLTAGALETPRHYDSTVHTGMQAFSKGMRLLKHLADSIMGPDVFITEAISPLFPHQYAHTRFVSTDVYSHLRDDEPGFPHYGSTEASLANGALMWWVQGTLWPYTNLDVCIMKNFQHNPDLSEQDIKVRLYAMMVMGSILGDGSDLRNPLAAERARKFLNNKALCAYFSHPEAFTPLRLADGDSMDQQLSFYRKGDKAMLAMFNFSRQQAFTQTYRLDSLGLKKGNYLIKDFLTNTVLGSIRQEQAVFSLTVPVKDACLVTFVPTH